MSFKKNKYSVLKNAISKDLANFFNNYLLMKRQVAKTLFETKFISPFTTYFGVWTDVQVPNTYSHYSDIAMETLLLKVQPLIEKETNLKLVPNYSYTRIYKNGDILKRHKDRPSCEISTTLNLGGDLWPIYLSTQENVGIPDGKKITTSSNAKGIKINLEPGDMLIYSGCILEHWREKFEGEECTQVFLHYNNEEFKNKKMFDGRIHLGLPDWFKTINKE
jgi:hypothetical protein